MVAEWEAAVTKFVELAPDLHYGTSPWRRSLHRAALHGKHGRIFVIANIDTFYLWFNQQDANSLIFWSPGIFHQNILDESHSLRTSGTPNDKFRKANGTMVKMDSHDYNMHMASYILCQELQYKWMLTVTRLVHGNKDLHWILDFLQSSCRLTLHLPLDTFDCTLNINNHWVTDHSNVSGTTPCAGFTPVAY